MPEQFHHVIADGESCILNPGGRARRGPGERVLPAAGVGLCGGFPLPLCQRLALPVLLAHGTPGAAPARLSNQAQGRAHVPPLAP